MKAVKRIYKKTISDTFLKRNLGFVLGSLMIGVLNYLYYPITSRLVSVETFGDIQVLVASTSIFAVVISAVGMFITHIVVNLDQEETDELVRVLTGRMLLVTLLLVAFGLWGGQHLNKVVEIQSPWVLPSVLTTFVIYIFYTFGRAVLQAKLKFGQLTFSGLIGSFLKIAITISLILIWGESSVSLSYTLAALAGLVVVLIALKRRHVISPLLISRSKQKLAHHAEFLGQIIYSVGVFSLFTFGDVLVVKSLFPAKIAGLYGGVSTIAKSIYFVVSPIGSVLFSEVKLSAGVNKNLSFLTKAMGLTVLFGGVAATLFLLEPSFFIGKLIGEKFLEFTELLRPLTFLYILVSINNLMVLFLLSIKWKHTHWLLTVSVVSGIISVLMFKTPTLQVVIYHFITVNVVLFLLAAIKIRSLYIAKNSGV